MNYVGFGEEFLGGTVLLVFGTVRYILISVFPYWQMLMADWQMIMAGAARSVVRYALCVDLGYRIGEEGKGAVCLVETAPNKKNNKIIIKHKA